MIVNGITHTHQKGGMLTMSDAKFASQQRRIRNREKRAKAKRVARQLAELGMVQ